MLRFNWFSYENRSYNLARNSNAARPLFETSFGRTYDRRILLITVHSEGTDGWAESVTGENPGFSSEWIESTWSTIKSHLASTLLRKTLSAASESPVLMRGIRRTEWQGGTLKRHLGC